MKRMTDIDPINSWRTPYLQLCVDVCLFKLEYGNCNFIQPPPLHRSHEEEDDDDDERNIKSFCICDRCTDCVWWRIPDGKATELVFTGNYIIRGRTTATGGRLLRDIVKALWAKGEGTSVISCALMIP